MLRCRTIFSTTFILIGGRLCQRKERTEGDTSKPWMLEFMRILTRGSSFSEYLTVFRMTNYPVLHLSRFFPGFRVLLGQSSSRLPSLVPCMASMLLACLGRFSNENSCARACAKRKSPVPADNLSITSHAIDSGILVLQVRFGVGSCSRSGSCLNGPLLREKSLVLAELAVNRRSALVAAELLSSSAENFVAIICDKLFKPSRCAGGRFRGTVVLHLT